MIVLTLVFGAFSVMCFIVSISMIVTDDHEFWCPGMFGLIFLGCAVAVSDAAFASEESASVVVVGKDVDDAKIAVRMESGEVVVVDTELARWDAAKDGDRMKLTRHIGRWSGEKRFPTLSDE